MARRIRGRSATGSALRTIASSIPSEMISGRRSSIKNDVSNIYGRNYGKRFAAAASRAVSQPQQNQQKQLYKMSSDVSNDRTSEILKKYSGDGVVPLLEDLSAKIDTLSSRVERIDGRLSPKNITVGKGDKRQTYRYDPLAPEGKKVTTATVSGAAGRFASKAESSAVLSKAAYLGNDLSELTRTKTNNNVSETNKISKEVAKETIKELKKTLSSETSMNRTAEKNSSTNVNTTNSRNINETQNVKRQLSYEEYLNKVNQTNEAEETLRYGGTGAGKRFLYGFTKGLVGEDAADTIAQKFRNKEQSEEAFNKILGVESEYQQQYTTPFETPRSEISNKENDPETAKIFIPEQKQLNLNLDERLNETAQPTQAIDRQSENKSVNEDEYKSLTSSLANKARESQNTILSNKTKQIPSPPTKPLSYEGVLANTKDANKAEQTLKYGGKNPGRALLYGFTKGLIGEDAASSIAQKFRNKEETENAFNYLTGNNADNNVVVSNAEPMNLNNSENTPKISAVQTPITNQVTSPDQSVSVPSLTNETNLENINETNNSNKNISSSLTSVEKALSIPTAIPNIQQNDVATTTNVDNTQNISSQSGSNTSTNPLTNNLNVDNTTTSVVTSAQLGAKEEVQQALQAQSAEEESEFREDIIARLQRIEDKLDGMGDTAGGGGFGFPGLGGRGGPRGGPRIGPGKPQGKTPTSSPKPSSPTTGTPDGPSPKTGGKSAGKTVAKSIGKSVLKKIPLVGAVAGLGFAASRALEGDFAGAALEVGSGLASTIPGIGTAASVGIDAALAARDYQQSEEGTLSAPEVESQEGETSVPQSDTESPYGKEYKVNGKSVSKEEYDQIRLRANEQLNEGIPENATNDIPDNVDPDRARERDRQRRRVIPRETNGSLQINSQNDVQAEQLQQRETASDRLTVNQQNMENTVNENIVQSQMPVAPTVINNTQQVPMPSPKSGPEGPITVNVRNTEPSVTTYNASIFDHPVTHPGIYKM